MKTIPGIGMRGGAGDKPVQVRCSACGGVAVVLAPGERAVLPPRGDAREARCACGAEVQLRVEVDRA